jgi:hypothetical protein
MTNSNRVPTTQALKKARQDEFANWLKKKVQINRDIDKCPINKKFAIIVTMSTNLGSTSNHMGKISQ